MNLRIILVLLTLAIFGCRTAGHTVGAYIPNAGDGGGGVSLPDGGKGAIWYQNNSGGVSALPASTSANTVLGLSAGIPAWGGPGLPDAGAGGVWWQDDAGKIQPLAAGTPGQLLVTNGSNGGAPYWGNVGYFGSTLTPPPLAGTWTVYNAGGRSSLLQDVNSTLLFSTDSGTTGYDARLAVQNTPSAHWNMIAHFAISVSIYNLNTVLVGIGCRQSSNGSIETYEIETGQATDQFTLHQATANNTSTSPTYTQSATNSYIVKSYFIAGSGFWAEYYDDGTNRVFSLSQNGVDWTKISSIAHASFLICDQYAIEIFSSVASAGNLAGRWDSLAVTSLP